MSEKITFENHSQEVETHGNLSDVNHNKEKNAREIKQEARHEHKENISKILDKIEKTAQSSDELEKVKHVNLEKVSSKNNSQSIGPQLRTQALKQSLKQIRQKLPRSQKAFSKIVHNKNIDRVSEITAQSIARPSGLLSAGIFSLLISFGVLVICRYYGYEYNYLIGLVSLGVGYLIGVLFEFGVKILKSPSSDHRL